MTNRPTTTTTLSANFQASNALSPLLRMQHSALRRRTTPAVMRHRVEAAKSSAALRPPFPSTAQTVTGLSEPFFVSPPQPVLPFVAFADASQQLSSAPPLPPLNRRSPTAHSAEAPPLALTTNAQLPRTTPHRRPHREDYTKRGQEMGSIGQKRSHLFAISHNFFKQVPVHGAMCPDNAHDQSAPQRLCGQKYRPLSRFLPSDLHLCPFLPIFAPIHVRKTSHPPSSSGLGLDSSPRPAAAIGGENLSLP